MLCGYFKVNLEGFLYLELDVLNDELNLLLESVYQILHPHGDLLNDLGNCLDDCEQLLTPQYELCRLIFKQADLLVTALFVPTQLVEDFMDLPK